MLKSILLTVLSSVAALFAGLWARQVNKNLKEERDRVQASSDAVDAAGKRLEKAHKTTFAAIDTKKRTDFEQQP